MEHGFRALDFEVVGHGSGFSFSFGATEVLERVCIITSDKYNKKTCEDLHLLLLTTPWFTSALRLVPYTEVSHDQTRG